MGCCLSLCGDKKSKKDKKVHTKAEPKIHFNPCPENNPVPVQFRSSTTEDILKDRTSIANENAQIPKVSANGGHVSSLSDGIGKSGDTGEVALVEMAHKSNVKSGDKARISDSMRVVTSIRRPVGSNEGTSGKAPGHSLEMEAIQDQSSQSDDSSLEIPSPDDDGHGSGGNSNSSSSFEKLGEDDDNHRDAKSNEWSELHDEMYNEISTRLGPDDAMEEKRASSQRNLTSQGDSDEVKVRPFSVELNVACDDPKRSSFYTVIGSNEE